MDLKDMLKLNLQMFAEGSEGTPDVDEPKEPEVDKSLTQDEVNRLVAQAKSKAKDEAKKELETSVEQRIAEAVERAKAEATLTGQELEKYKQAEAEREKQAMADEIAQLKLERTRSELKEQAIVTLSKKSIDVDEDTLKIVVRDTAEETLDFIDALSRVLAKKKNKDAADKPPYAGGGLSGQSKAGTPGNIFREANILNKKQ